MVTITKHPDALYKPNANKVKKMKNIKLDPKCMRKRNSISSIKDHAENKRGSL